MASSRCWSVKGRDLMGQAVAEDHCTKVSQLVRAAKRNRKEKRGGIRNHARSEEKKQRISIKIDGALARLLLLLFFFNFRIYEHTTHATIFIVLLYLCVHSAQSSSLPASLPYFFCVASFMVPLISSCPPGKCGLPSPTASAQGLSRASFQPHQMYECAEKKLGDHYFCTSGESDMLKLRATPAAGVPSTPTAAFHGLMPKNAPSLSPSVDLSTREDTEYPATSL